LFWVPILCKIPFDTVITITGICCNLTEFNKEFEAGGK
jgi:hypothetical protein